MRFVSLLLLALLAWPAYAEPHPLALRALETLDLPDLDSWSYTRATTSNDGARVERHHAGRPEGKRWELVSVDGKVPTPRQREEYQREKREQAEARKKKGKNDRDLDRNSIRLVSETDTRAVFSFLPAADSEREAKLMKQVRGTLVVDKTHAWAEEFRLESSGEIQPIPGVTVREFRLLMKFRRDEATGHILPVSMTSRVRGRAMLVKSLDQDRKTVFSEFIRN